MGWVEEARKQDELDEGDDPKGGRKETGVSKVDSVVPARGEEEKLSHETDGKTRDEGKEEDEEFHTSITGWYERAKRAINSA